MVLRITDSFECIVCIVEQMFLLRGLSICCFKQEALRKTY